MIVPKLTVTNYAEMLRKLSGSAFLITLICTTALRMQVKQISEPLNKLDLLIPSIPTIDLQNWPLTTLLIALLVAILSEAIKLHDRISWLFRIREEFDIRYILIPMALLCNSKISFSQFQKITQQRNQLMGQVFYEYVSSSKDKCVIDPHDVVQALTSWSWYWVCLEAELILGVTASIFLYIERFLFASIFLISIFLLLLLQRIFYFECIRYAESQIQKILSDSNRKHKVSATFDAL